MIITPTTKMLTLSEVAERLGVSKAMVEVWVYNGDLASFKKGENRRVSEESLARFVILHTVNPKRPSWLTAKVESEFVAKLREIVRAELMHERMAA